MTEKYLEATYKLNLDRILKEKGISKYKIAQDTGISEKTLYAIGKRDLQLSTILKICTYLDITLCQLISIK